jgi:capsular polysaccharide biosynthesis protein
MNDVQDTQQELSLLDLWYMLLRHIWFIISVTALFFILASVYAFFIVTPDYISRADIMVQVEQSSSSASDQNFDLVNAGRLLDTVRELMTKEVVLQKALETLSEQGYTDLTVGYLRSGLTITSSNTSFFINIAFVDEDTELAEAVVNAVISAVIDITDVEDAFPVLTNKIRRTSFASEATYNSPNRILFAVIGIVLGGIVSVGIVFLKELLATNFKSKDEIERMLNLQVLGIIPLMELKESKHGKK